MSDADAQTMALPAIVDLDALESVRDQLIEAIEHGPVTIDASGVERVATNALLMLLSAAESAKRVDFKLLITGVSTPMSAAIDRLGMNDVFEPILEGISE